MADIHFAVISGPLKESASLLAVAGVYFAVMSASVDTLSATRRVVDGIARAKQSWAFRALSRNAGGAPACAFGVCRPDSWVLSLFWIGIG